MAWDIRVIAPLFFVLAASIGSVIRSRSHAKFTVAAAQARTAPPPAHDDELQKSYRTTHRILFGFLVVVIGFGAWMAVEYRAQIRAHRDDLSIGFGLLLIMIAGMLAQVFASQARAGLSLRD